MKYIPFQTLEAKKNKAAIFIQSRWRLYKARSAYLQQKKATVMFQSLWREREGENYESSKMRQLKFTEPDQSTYLQTSRLVYKLVD